MNRREFLGSLAMGAAGVATAGASGAEPAPIVGRVTAVRRGPMAGVIVSDGLVCVRTDEKGEFRLPARPGARFVTVTTPSGYRCNEERSLAIPRKYQSYDFLLVRHPASERKGCAFVQIADSEIGRASGAEKKWIQRVKDLADEVDAAFIVHTGDICRRSGLLAHQWLMNDATMERPTIYCLGNHDLEIGPAGESMFEMLYGPAWYSFEAGGVHFCVTPMPYGDYKPSYSMDEVADWLRNDLALVPKGMPVVVFNHMISNWGGPEKDIGFVFGDARKFDLRTAANLTGFVYGHVHSNRFVRHGKTTFCCTATPEKGGIDLSPASVRVIRVDADGRLSSELRYGSAAGKWRPNRAGAVWEQKVAAPVLYGEPVASDGLVLVGTSDEDGKGTGGVTALDAATGREVWRRPLAASVKGRMIALGGNLIVQDCDGGLFAFRVKDGAPVWQNPVRPHPWHWVQSGLAVDRANGVVFAGKAETLSAVEAATGRVIWKDGKWPGGRPEPCADASGYGEGILVSAGNWKGLFANDAKTGRLLWQRTETIFQFPGATPVVRDGKVISLGHRSLFELDAKTGRTLREVDVGAKLQVTTTVVETDDLYLFGSSGRGLVALDKQTLKVRWTGDVDEAFLVFAAYAHEPEKSMGTTPVVVGDKVVASAADGTVHVWRLSDGKNYRDWRTGAPYLAGVTVADGRVYAADLAGYVRAFDLSEM